MQLLLRVTLSALVGAACLMAGGCMSDAITGSVVEVASPTPPASVQQRIVERPRSVASSSPCANGAITADCVNAPAAIENPTAATLLSEPLPAGVKPLALEQEEQFGKGRKKK